MDGTSSSNPRIDFGPTSPGWGEARTVCNNTPYQYPLTAELTSGAITFCGACGCWNGEHQTWCTTRGVCGTWHPADGAFVVDTKAPRRNWYADMTDEDRLRMTACAQNPNPLITPEIRAAMMGGPLPPRPASSLSEADIERIVEWTAQRVLALLRKETP